MTDEAKTKRPVPPQFLKKKKETEEAKTSQLIGQLPPTPEEIIVKDLTKSQKEIDMQGLIKDLMFNKYFLIMEKEARPIAEKMVNEGFESLHEVKWFLAHSERVQLAKELKEKYGLLK